MTQSFDNTVSGYIYHSISYETSYNNTIDDRTEDVDYVDVFYVNIDDKLPTITNDIERNEYIVNNCLSCLRFYNFYVSFYIVKLPGMKAAEFRDFIDKRVNKIRDVVVKYKTSFRKKPFIESSYFGFNRNTLYAKIKSKSSSKLKHCYNTLKKAIKEYYDKIAKGDIELNNWDRLFYDNTETPFRNDMTTLTATNVRYYLSTKYNIPCVGGFVFSYNNNQARTLNQFPTNEAPGYKFMSFVNKDLNKEYKTLYIDMEGHNKLFHQIKHNDEINGQQYLTLMTYDIETYESNLRQLEESEKIIMCIGIGVFNITNDKPFMRYCLSLKDFTEDDKKQLGSKYVECPNESNENRLVRYVYNEYTEPGQTCDFTKYIICANERIMFERFVKLINKHRPTFLSGFNNYGFDDRRLFDRMVYYEQNNLINNVLQYYDFSKFNNTKKHVPKQLVINQNTFSIKIDGEMYNDNITWTGETKTFVVDVYKIMLASNAKLYTQQGRGNLDTMLSVNGICNPFNGQPLSKSGLSYNQMWFNWDNNKNIYDIMLYCCQDSWICGTLLIKSCQLIDKIEMSTLSATTISDSIYKAVTWRVKHIIEKYAWDNNFAVADSVSNIVDKDGKHISRADNHTLGNKQFDTRQIVGGEVKNVVSGRQNYVIALDFSAMYPSQKEGSNIDTSSCVPDDVVEHPDKYGLSKYHDDVDVFDMYKQRKIVYLENKQHDKYIIEKFQSVFKNNINEIRKVLDAMEIDNQTGCKARQSLIEILTKLQPNTYNTLTDMIYNQCKTSAEVIKNIPDTETRYLYTVQSPRDDSNNVIKHYSLKEIMLSDLRSLRSKVKHQMEAATNPIDKSRYNSKQLAIKVMCNSEYGASNSSYFPYYDTLIGGATTAASRCLINFLTNIIQTDKLYVNKQFMQSNKEYLDHLAKYGVVKWRTITVDNPDEFVKNNRRFALRKLFDEYYNIIENIIYEITIEPSMVVYQDTDSNYYTNNYIKQLFSPLDNNRNIHLKTYYRFIVENYPWSTQFNNFDNYYKWIVERDNDYEDPTMINLKMNLLLSHNNLVGNFIKDSIYRKPISVGFEGAFTIVRYFNVKKKYYGHVWNDRMLYVLPKECYDNGVLKQDYTIEPAKSCYPLLANGDYVYVDEPKLLSPDTDKLTYIKKQNIKLTGVDLARRDQYKFININHIKLIQQDIHYLKYIGDNKWVNISNTNMYDIVMDLLKQYKQQFIDIDTLITNMQHNNVITQDIQAMVARYYSLNDYAKDVSFKYTKANFIVCKTRIFTDTDKKQQYERYLIVDYKEKLSNGFYKSEAKTYTTSKGSLLLTLSRDEDGNYINVFSTEYEHIHSKIPKQYNGLFHLKRINDNDICDECYIDYDCVNWEKQAKVMMTIGNRMYKTIQTIKDNTHARISEKTFSENFPAGFSRKQYVIMLTEACKQDRMKGTKTESVKNSDKAYLIKELHNQYKQRLSIDEYNKLDNHEAIPYKQFIDLLIINDLDHIHYTEAFASAISLYLIEYAKDILTTKDYNTIKHLISKDVVEDENNNKSITDIKKLISWQLLINIYPDRIRKKPTIKRFTNVNEQLYKDDLTHDEYKQLLLSNDPNVIENFNNRLNNGAKQIYIIEDWELDTLTSYEQEYPKYKDIVKKYYNTYCGTTDDIPWRTVVERSPILLSSAFKSYRKFEKRQNDIHLCENVRATNDTINSEIFKPMEPCVRWLYNNPPDEIDNAIKKELAKLKRYLARYEKFIELLENIINIMNSNGANT